MSTEEENNLSYASMATGALSLAFLVQAAAYGANPNGVGFDFSTSGPYYYLEFDVASYNTSGLFGVNFASAATSQNLKINLSLQNLFMFLFVFVVYGAAMIMLRRGLGGVVKSFSDYQPIMATALVLSQFFAWSAIGGVLSYCLGDKSAVSFGRFIGNVLAFAGIMYLGDVDKNIVQKILKSELDAEEQTKRLVNGKHVFKMNKRMIQFFMFGWVIGLAFFLVLIVPLFMQLSATTSTAVLPVRPDLLIVPLSFYIIDLFVQFGVFSANIYQRVNLSNPEEWADVNMYMSYGTHIALFVDITIFVWTTSSLFAKAGDLALGSA